MIVQSNGTLCYDADFIPFGGERAYTNTCAQNYKFEGKERDTETQNDDFGGRYYSSRFGRWLSADWSAVPAPVPYANLANPQTLNLYSMVADDPESFADLDGHMFWAPFLGNGPIGNISLLIASGAGPSELSQGLSSFGSADPENGQNQNQAQSQQSNRQPDDSYKATPAQLAKIKEAADKKTTIGNGQCVTACERFTGVPGPTSSWEGGNPASELTNKDKGTAIATFVKGPDGRWRYLPDANGHMNSGTFMSKSTNGTFWMADQWPQGKPVTIWNVTSNPNNASMNAASYRVIIVPNP